MNDAPIGIFDSGVGGLTVARSILDQLPQESIHYIGDTANSPYGPKPIAAVRAMALEIMDRLVDEGVKMLVIACNTASAAMFHEAKERYAPLGIPVVDPTANFFDLGRGSLAAAQLVARIEPYGFFIVMALVVGGIVGTLWLRPLMSLGYAAINLLLLPITALLR